MQPVPGGWRELQLHHCYTRRELESWLGAEWPDGSRGVVALSRRARSSIRIATRDAAAVAGGARELAPGARVCVFFERGAIRIERIPRHAHTPHCPAQDRAFVRPKILELSGFRIAPRAKGSGNHMLSRSSDPAHHPSGTSDRRALPVPILAPSWQLAHPPPASCEPQHLCGRLLVLVETPPHETAVRREDLEATRPGQTP